MGATAQRDREAEGEAPRAHFGTSTMNLVPRTPSSELGVRTCMASRPDLAILPDTIASDPRSTCVTNEPCWRVRSYSNLLTAIRLLGPTAKRVLSMKVRLIRPVLPVSR